MVEPLGAAGADLVEALVRGAMTSPYAAADPAGGYVVARLIEQLAHTDSSRVERLLAGTSGAQFEVEVHRTGDIVPEVVLRDLSAVDALGEAVRRAGDPGRSVELVVVPGNGEDEVILASRPGQQLSYLFADDVRAAAAKLPPSPPPVPGPIFRRDHPEPGSFAASIALPSAGESAGHLAPAPVHATSGGGMPAGDLSSAIETALSEMSIQVDLAGVAELVQEAVIEHLRTEALGGVAGAGASPDPDAVAASVAAHLSSLPALSGGLSGGALREVLLELTETIALRDRRLAMEQQRMQMQLEALHAQIQHAEHALTGAFDDVTRDLSDQGDDMRREVLSLTRQLDDQLRDVVRSAAAELERIDVAAPAAAPAAPVHVEVEGADELRRASMELSMVADRLDSLVRHLDQSVDLRALGRTSRAIERAALSMSIGSPAPVTPAVVEPSASSGATAPAPPADKDASDRPGAAAGSRPRARIRQSATPGDHPLRLVDRRSSEPPGA